MVYEKDLRKGVKRCCLENHQVKVDIIAGERGLEGTSQVIKDTRGVLYFQTCKIDVNLPRYIIQKTDQSSYFYFIISLH